MIVPTHSDTPEESFDSSHSSFFSLSHSASNYAIDNYSQMTHSWKNFRSRQADWWLFTFRGFKKFSIRILCARARILDHLLHTAAAKSLQSCPTLCDPTDGSPPGSPVPGILQARTLEWVAISFSNAWKWKVKVKSLSRVQPSATPWTAAFQAPPSVGFSRQEYWSGVPLHTNRLHLWCK